MNFKKGLLPNLIFGLILLIDFIKTQLTDLPLGIEEKFTADLQRFFKLDLTDSANHHNLILHVSPLDNYENWSDPDIYISKTYHYPSPYNNDYSSSRVGDDIVIIPIEDLKNSTELYAGITCGKRCEFKIKAYYEDREITIQNGQEFFFFFDNKTAETEAILKFYPEKDKFYEVYTFSPKLKDYEFAVTLHHKNSKMNILLQNSWLGGFSAFLEPNFIKDSPDGCKNCYYRFVISAKPNSDIFIGVKESFVNQDIVLNKYYMSSLLPDKYNCYYFNKTLFSKEELEKNTDKVIISASSHLQDVGLVILDDYKNLKKEANDGRIEFNFKEEVIARVNFTQIVNKYLCMESYLNKYTSYSLFVYRESEAEANQRLNFLTNGLSKSGYLPAGKVTSYLAFDNSLNATSLSLNLVVKEGNPVLYAYVCLNIYDCSFTSENFEHFRPNLISTTKINNEYSISIPREDNICKKLKDENHPSFRTCAIMSVVKCESNIECSFLISMHYSDGMYLLKDRIKNTKFIKINELDYYQISNKDEASNKLSIILHSHTGDADLYVSRTHKNPMDDPNVLSSTTTLGNRDHIEIYDTSNDINVSGYKSSLVGNYYIAVKGFQNSFYSIFYFTSFDPNPTKAINYIEAGLMHSDIATPDESTFLRIANPEKQQKKPFVISALSLNCVGELSVSKDGAKSTDPDYAVLTSPKNKKTSHNQIIISPVSPFYNSNLYFIDYKVYDNDEDIEKDKNEKTKSCLYYISGNALGSELMLNEGIPHIFTLNTVEENLNSFSYVYPHIYKNKNPCLIDVYFENKFVNLVVIISFENSSSQANPSGGAYNRESFEYKLIAPENIIIKSSTLEKNCHNAFSCNIHIQVKYSKNASDSNNASNSDYLTYKITARSNSLVPAYLKRGEVKHDSVIPNNYQYYYSELKKNESGEIILKSKSGSGILVGKIVKKNAPKEPNADFNNVALPTTLNSSLRFNMQTNSLYFDSQDTKICDGGCEIYFGVYSENRENYKDSLNQYSILLSTGIVKLKFNEHYFGSIDTANVQNLVANPSAKIQYFTLLAEENQFSRVSISLIFSGSFQGKLLVNYGEPEESVPLPTIEKSSFYISEQECSNCRFDFTINKKAKKFVIGVYADMLRYANMTSSVEYQLYAADISYIDSKNFYEIKLGDTVHCTTISKDQYCDFLMILPNTDTLIFYTQFLKEFYTNYEEHFLDSVILANIYNATDYKSLKESEQKRPRLDNNPMFMSGVASEATKEYKIFPDNNLLIFKNPYKSYASDNKNANYNQTILCVSVFLQKPSAFKLLSNRISVASSVISLNYNIPYLFMVTNAETLKLKIPNYGKRMLQKSDSDLYTLNVHSVLGEAQVNFDNKPFKMNSQTKNLKIVLNKANSQEITVNSYNHKEAASAVPYICIVNLNINFYKTELSLGDSFDMLFPSLFYPKQFYFLAYNDTYANIPNDIDVTFNFKVLEYKNQRASLALGKNDKFAIKNHYSEDVFSRQKVPVENYNLGEYDHVNKVGMITTKLKKDKSYIINYDVHLTSEKTEDEFESFSKLSNSNDYLLMRVVFSSDNFKYTKAALPYKTYYYSSINSERIGDSSKKDNKIYHIHRLTRKNLLDNFFYIELASCGNEFSYSLRDYKKLNDVKDEDFYLNKTDLKHEYKYHYGKKIIEVELNDVTRDLLLIVFPLKTYNKFVCQDIRNEKVCESSFYSDYVVRYRTSKSRIDLEKYKIDKEGLVTLRYNNTDNPSDFTINWGSVLERNENYQYEAVAESKMIIRFYDARKVEASELNSICFFDNSNALVEHIEIDNFHRNQDSYNYKVSKSVNYQISIIAETIKDNTYLAYIPTYVYIKIGGHSITLIVLLVLLIFLLLFIMFLIYRKYRLTKKRLDYEISDIRNMASVPRDDSFSAEIKMINMPNTSSINGDKKYVSLTEAK